MTSYFVGAMVIFLRAEKHLPILSMALKQGIMIEMSGLVVIQNIRLEIH